MKGKKSNIDVLSSNFIENEISMKKLLTELNSYFKLSKLEGNKDKIKRARRRKKLLAREKIDLLLDKNKPHIELMSLAGLKHENGFGAGGTTVVVLGYVSNVLCLINANVATRKAGAIDYATSLKNLRLSQIANENKLLTINLVESGGANLPDQDRVFNNYGKFFMEMSRRSKEGIPTISVVFGNATAGGAYVPGMSDYSILQKNAAKVFLAGPPLVKMATNEDANEEELGGAQMHSSISGVSDFLANDEKHAIEIAKNLIKKIKQPDTNNYESDASSPKFDKNGLIPVITIAGINIGTLVAFSIITETVFQWPGMGFLFIQAVQFVDIPIMSAYLVFIAFVFVMINFIVDILYYFIDPRIRVKGDATSG